VSFARAASWMRAEVSAIVGGALEGDALEARLDACRSCHRFEAAADAQQVGWCTACGCGKRARAELSVKARMPAATCPLDRWPRDTGGSDGSSGKAGAVGAPQASAAG